MTDVHCWIAIVGDVVARDLVRGGWRRLPLPLADAGRPEAGDRLAVLRTHRPAFVSAAACIGTADVLGDDGHALAIRHRVVAPPMHEPPLAAIPHLRVATGWTDVRLGALVGTVVPVVPQDHARIEDAVRVQALAHGPAPRRPQHRRPRTPGRRALVVGRMVARRLPASR